MTTEPPSPLSAALAYAAHGWPVFQLNGKVPLPRSRGFHDATTDPDEIAARWARVPGANIGIPTGPASGLAVLDVDGEQGRRSLAAIEAEHGPLPGTVTAITSRGCHLLYRWTPGLGNTAGRHGAGLDTRGEGGYIVAPPSVHPSGHRYRWLTADDSDPRPWAHPLPAWPVRALPVDKPTPSPPPAVVTPLPVRGLALAEIRSSPGGVLAGLLRVVLEAPEGERNTRLNWAAFRAGEHIRSGQLDADQAVAALLLAAERVGLGLAESRATIASGITSGVAA